MVAMVLLALSSRLQPGEHHVHYSHGRRESTHSEEFFSIRQIVRKDQAQLLAINSNRVLQPSRCIPCHGGLKCHGLFRQRLLGQYLCALPRLVLACLLTQRIRLIGCGGRAISRRSLHTARVVRQ